MSSPSSQEEMDDAAADCGFEGSFNFILNVVNACLNRKQYGERLFEA
jgi:hypothetical protein